MKTLEFIYQDTEIHFLLNPSDENVMVNATEMAKPFNKEVDNFLRLSGTKEFIKELIESENSNIIPSDVRGYLSEKDIIIGRKRAGTLMHRKLALKFAAWLDVKFELWVFSTIDKILFGNLKEYKDAMKQEVEAQKRKKPLTYNLKNNPCKETVEAYFKNEELLADAQRRKRKASENQKNLFEQDFVVNNSNF